MTNAHFTTSDGVTLAVTERGRADADACAVLLHGWTEAGSVWDDVTARLGDTMRVLALDLRGHGDSDPAPRGSATLDRLADDVVELIAARVPESRIVLAGHSMGGMTMMALAERYPDVVEQRVSGAVFVATSSGQMQDVMSRMPAPIAAADRWRRRLARRKSGGRTGSASAGTKPPVATNSATTGPAPNRSRSAGRGALPVPSKRLSRVILRAAVFGESPDAAHVRAAVDQCARAHRGSAAGFNRSIMTHDRAAALAAFAGVPTAVLVGDRDRLTPLSHAHAIANQLPNAEFVLFAGAGHMLPYERPDGVATAIRTVAAQAAAP
ncbi:alpha/beta fold hydrolase [Haloechinothrix halophila]|uniref:alpha/beta fold hydrolase n=1 Tax=Haloechinothrix halophila TaxID=1069073 RepID=UPI0003F4F0CE|nr:alpha/beta hydrolase [Haloechinothrix halophila]